MEQKQSDLLQDYVTATRVYGSSMEPAYNRLKQVSSDVAAVVDVYKSVEKQAGVNLVNSDDNHHRNAYEVLEKVARSRVESNKIEPSDPVDIQRTAVLLLNDNKASAEKVELALNGTTRTREYLTRLSSSIIQINNSENIAKLIEEQNKISPQFSARLKEIIEAPKEQRGDVWMKLYNDISAGKLDSYPHAAAKWQAEPVSQNQLNDVGAGLAKLTQDQQDILAKNPLLNASLALHHQATFVQNGNVQGAEV